MYSKSTDADKFTFLNCKRRSKFLEMFLDFIVSTATTLPSFEDVMRNMDTEELLKRHGIDLDSFNNTAHTENKRPTQLGIAYFFFLTLIQAILT